MSHTIRRFRPTDDDAVLAFTATLPEHDLLFSGRDLRHPRVIEAWQQAVGEGWIDSLVAEDGSLIALPLPRDAGFEAVLDGHVIAKMNSLQVSSAGWSAPMGALVAWSLADIAAGRSVAPTVIFRPSGTWAVLALVNHCRRQFPREGENDANDQIGCCIGSCGRDWPCRFHCSGV